jgi:hypothetical protein
MRIACGLRMPRRLALLGLLALVVSPALVNAHHSAVAFDLSKPHVSVTGKVLQFIWRSPHTSINLEVINTEGVAEVWKWEGAGTVALVKSGVTRETIKAGDTLTVSGNPLRDGSPGGLMRSITLANGEHIDFGESASQ